ncbi:MAG: nitrogen fixation protein NifQ [Rhodospirillaceae bacterium]|nr:nitrogen fixation protein NifQ [Rhodospirillaceae bacterium]
MAGAPGQVDHADDRHVFACVLALALAERAAGGGPLTERLGIGGRALAAIAEAYFPEAGLPDLDVTTGPLPADQSALATLLVWRGQAVGAKSQILAAIVARRSLEAHHLWQDLGLRNRAELSALMGRHFPRMKQLNDTNMRWKKFFYRQICRDPGMQLCLAPTCEECEEKDLCFAPEEGDALI